MTTESMRFRFLWVRGASFALLFTVSSDVSRALNPATLPFAPGETLTYDLTWSVFPAGHVVATLNRVGDGEGDAYEIKTTARSQGFVSLLYGLRDEFHSLFDPSTGCSRRISKTIKEGRRHKETQIIFDGSRKLAILNERDLAKPNAPAKHAENEIPACVEDVVTAFYFLRKQPLHVGQEIQVPVNDGAETHEVTVQVQAREEIQTPLGRRLAFRVEPTVFGGLYKRKGRMLVWFSDDEQRLPLRIKAMISVGTIVCNLRSVTESPQRTGTRIQDLGSSNRIGLANRNPIP